MTAAIDTNIFVYAYFDHYAQHEAARAFLRRLTTEGSPFFLAWQVYYEYIRIATHPRIHAMPLSVAEATRGMNIYLDHPTCRILQETPDHHRIFGEIIKKLPSASGNFIHDCHYAALLKENGLNEIVTADMDFRKFDFLKVVNPVV